ncbi:MAG TPA: ABC transporter permease [Thermoplasmata archaeon]|nr:ABC transporter permease [Thermoplasmata archaeon]
MAAEDILVGSGPLRVPASMQQVGKLTRYQFREYLRSRRFVALAAIVLLIGAILTAVVGYYRTSVISTNLAFYGSFWGSGADIVIVLAAVFFGGDAIAGEFQNKTGYFLMGLPLRRSTVYVGKFIAAYAASLSMLLLFLVVLVGNGVYYFGSSALPWQLGLSLLIAIVYLSAVLGATFLFSSLFKTSAYGFVLTAILFLFGFTLLQDLVTGLVKIEPWMIISYAESTIGSVFSSSVNWGIQGSVVTTTTMFGRRAVTTTTYTAGIAEGIVIMIAYLVITAVAGLWLFEREEFT